MIAMLKLCAVATCLTIASCAAPRKATTRNAATEPSPPAAVPTRAQKLVQLMDRSPQRMTTCSWTEFEPDAKALGIATPPALDVWQDMLEAGVDASWPTQFCLFEWGEHFGPAYYEAAYRAFNGKVRNIWLRMACVDWEIATARDQLWVAESALHFTQSILETEPEPYPSPNGDIKGITAEGGWLDLRLPSVWAIPSGARSSRADMLAWVNGAIADRAHWYYSDRERWVSPGAQDTAGNVKHPM